MRKRLTACIMCGFLLVSGLCGCQSGGQTEAELTQAVENDNAENTENVENVESGITPEITEELTIADISSTDLVADMKIGWNLGNTLDATGGVGIMSETSWGNPKTSQEMIDAILDAGFNVIRIPVTWDGHFGEAPEYKIHDIWIQRVKEVVDYAYEKDAYVILNMHHEEWYFPTEENKVANGEQIAALWTQIAAYFKDYDERLIFEGLNEPRLRGTSKEWTGDKTASEVINYWEQLFVDAVRATGGNNTLRHLMITGYAASSSRDNLAAIVLPEDEKLIVSVHAYTPYNFALNTTGTSTWDESKDARDIDTLMKAIEELFISKGIPVIIGEFGAMNKDNETERVEWAQYYLTKAKEIGVPCVWWDNNAFSGTGERFGLLDRRNKVYTYPELLKAMMEVANPEAVEYLERVAPTVTPEPTATPVPEITVAPTATPEPTATPVPEITAAPTATPEATATPVPEITAAPTATPEATATPVPEIVAATVTEELEGKKLIAITVDDGPDGSGTENFLALAREYDIPLTFFVVGKNINSNPNQLQDILDARCEIGNHSMTHGKLDSMDATEIKSEIDQTNELIAQYAPSARMALVRAPYFAYNETVQETVSYPLIDAAIYESGNDAAATLEVLLGASNGDIMLMHTWNTASLQALKEAVPKLQEAGFAFVTVSQLFEINNLEPTNGTIYRNVKKNILAEYTAVKNLFTGEKAASGDWSNWETAVELKAEDIKNLTEGQALTVEYKSSLGPCLILQSWSGGPNWVQITPSFDNGATAIFTYEDILAAYGEALTNVNAAIIRPYGADLTATRVDLVTK